jgi:8-oxo-dGTP diphosphatase
MGHRDLARHVGQSEAPSAARPRDLPPLAGPWWKYVVSTLIIEDHHVLMVREGHGAERLRWNLPGGKVAEGERLVDAAVREAREETGYEVRVHSFGAAYSYLNRAGRACLRLLFHGHITGGEADCDGAEILDLRWFPLDQARALSDHRLAKPDLLRPILEHLRRPVRHPLALIHDFEPERRHLPGVSVQRMAG